jgi:hypothetical protein
MTGKSSAAAARRAILRQRRAVPPRLLDCRAGRRPRPAITRGEPQTTLKELNYHCISRDMADLLELVSRLHLDYKRTASALCRPGRHTV